MSAWSARQQVAERLKDRGIRDFYGQGESSIVIRWNEMERLLDEHDQIVAGLRRQVEVLTSERDEAIANIEEVHL